jgi:hypothetical protein
MLKYDTHLDRGLMMTPPRASLGSIVAVAGRRIDAANAQTPPLPLWKHGRGPSGTLAHAQEYLSAPGRMLSRVRS